MNAMGKIALCFPGQGAQRKGMFKELYEEYKSVKQVFDVASGVCNFDVAKVCFEDPDEVLNMTEYTQPCILACDIAGFELLRTKKIEMDYMAGFSLGEYAALYATGCIKLEDVFQLVCLRAEAMQKAVPIGEGGMMAVFSSKHDEIDNICNQVKGIVQIANYNSPTQVVISGETSALEKAAVMLRNKDIKYLKLAVSIPSHCKLMLKVIPVLEDFLSKIILTKPKVPIVMNYTGCATQDIDIIKKNMLLQIAYPVKWTDSVEFLNNQQVHQFVECGPGTTLSKFIRQTVEGCKMLRINNRASFEKTVHELSI